MPSDLSQNSVSPSTVKRPSIAKRNSSTPSLSSSAKQPSSHKALRPHMAGRVHARTSSHGKNLSKLAKVNSSQNLDIAAPRALQPKKSGLPSPPLSPGSTMVKRNSSHTALTKNTSHVSLRKNPSATAVNRNHSHAPQKKSTLGPATRQPKENTKKGPEFELGDQSSDDGEEREAEWVDSANQSPEVTRRNSVSSIHSNHTDSNQPPPPQRPPEPQPLHYEKTSSPLNPSLPPNNRSTPNFSTQKADTSNQPPPGLQLNPSASPALLQNPRSSRAPPAMSSILAHGSRIRISRNNSSNSLAHITHDDAASYKTTSVNTSSSSQPRVARGSSSAEGGVSHFLSGSTSQDIPPQSGDEGSSYDSPSSFLPNYHPQPSSSPEKQRVTSKQARALPHVASRTQQRLELQRRETMRSSSAPNAPTSPTTPDPGLSFGSSVSLHSRSGSRGQNRSAGEETKAIRRDYEAAAKQLSVVRRFRSPVQEGLNRLKSSGILPPETGILTPSSSVSAGRRPVSRPGTSLGGFHGSMVSRPLSRSFEEKRPSPMASRPSSRGGSGAGGGPFPKDGSHDDMVLSRSRGSYEEDVSIAGEDVAEQDYDALSVEEAMIRRIWESRDVYDGADGVDGRHV